MMLSCRKASRLISDAMDRELGACERISLQFHMLLCANCRNFRRQMTSLRAGIHAGKQR